MEATSMPAAAAGATDDVTWSDPKRYLWLLGLVVPLAPFLAWALVEVTGLGFLWWFGPALVFVIFPFLDQVIGKDSSNPPDSVLKWLEEDKYYRWCTYLFIPIQYAGLVFACWIWAYGGLSFLENLGLAMTVAMVAGIAINTAHELGHKRKSYEKWLSKISLAQTGYGHFFIEHNRGHHVRVSTPEDPASSRLGESYWEFLPRTVWGSLTSALHLEKQRLDRMGKSVLLDPERRAERLADDRGALRRADRRVRLGRGPVAALPGGGRLPAARGRELPGALRAAAPEAGGRPLRALRTAPQLEQQQHRLQRAALPPAAPLGPPRQPDAPLPGAQALRRDAGAARRATPR